MSTNDSRYLRRAPGNLETPVDVPVSSTPGLPYWDSEIFVFNATKNTSDLCPAEPTDTGNGDHASLNITPWKEIGLGVLGGLIISKLLR